MTFLLDVNVLIALLDSRHVAHDAAHDWFGIHGAAWATCPLTQNGLVRILSGPKYRLPPTPVRLVASTLEDLTSRPGHVFWPDDISLIEGGWIDVGRLSASGQITDTYLLALAVKNRGRLATFDRRLSTQAVKGGQAALHIIGG